MVNGLAYRILGRPDEVDDLVQDSFVQALSSLDRLQNPAAFSSWMGSIVVRTAHKRLRRRSLRTRLGLERDKPIDVEILVSRTAPPDVAIELRAVYGILNRLSAEERVALVLRRVEGMKLAEVAEAMNLSLATVKRRLAKAEKAVAAALEASS